MKRSAGTAIRLVVGGRVRTLDDVDPGSTVLTWLRETERRTGTKEGCAEGDCGACTVVVGELDGEAIRYRAVNACILCMGALDGKELVTVEDLPDSRGALHPVQRALVEAHGSQCGFCTPGIVMSLFALSRSGAAPTSARIRETLAGNLCRCTGYRPIVEAARAMQAAGADARAAETVRLLESIRRDEALEVAHATTRWLAPTSLDELARLATLHPDAVVLAGGTDLGRRVTKEHRDLGTVLWVGGVEELRRIAATATHLEIGAAAPLADVVEPLGRVHPSLAALLRRFGSAQIRNVATLGGNVGTASPVGDLLPPLLALGATVVVRCGPSEREAALETLLAGRRRAALDRGEVIVRVRIPLPPASRRFAVYKVSKRLEQDIAAVCAAFSIELDGDRVRDARLAYGGMAETARRAPRAERALAGRAWSGDAVSAAEAALERDLTPITDQRASAGYRMRVAKNLLRRFLLETTGAAVARLPEASP